MVSRCPRSQMNASGHFARTLNKRNRHQLSRCALPHIHPTTKRLTTLQFAGAGDETVSGKEYKNITVRLAAPSPLSIAFSTKQAICSCEHSQAKLCLSLLTLPPLRPHGRYGSCSMNSSKSTARWKNNKRKLTRSNRN
jgi:hypothetical protein